jgi:hypothetical protein
VGGVCGFHIVVLTKAYWFLKWEFGLEWNERDDFFFFLECCSCWLLLLKWMGAKSVFFFRHINPGEKGDGEP